ncbi:MAG: VOC family protein [Rubrivivax sp.]|nr:VOC family protein [Rubrivivax sp.]
MDVFKTHGAFSWSELTTGDPAAAAAFYGPLFGWRVEAMDTGGGLYHLLKVGDTAVGGIMKTPAEAGTVRPAWGCYVTVDNTDATVAQATALGGKVVVPAMDIPGVGRMAVIADPQGAMLSVMQYSPG